MKKHLLTRILSIILAFTILFSDISAFASSDIVEEPAVSQAEEIIEETNTETENNDEEMLESESTLEADVPIVEEVVTEEQVVEESQEIIEGKLDDICYFVPETETAATAIGMYSLADGQVSLKDSSGEKWIDRLDLSDAAEIRAFYDTLVEASDNDGENDFLIDDVYLGSDYNLEITEVKQTVEVNLSNAADESVVKDAVQAAVSEAAGSVAAKYDPYIIAARDAFDRDHPEVFWLSGETAIGYSLSYGYLPPEETDTSIEAEYTLTLMMVLRGTVNGEAFDIRATEYQGQEAIKNAIFGVDSACDMILDDVSEFNDYEKKRYFNVVLT